MYEFHVSKISTRNGNGKQSRIATKSERTLLLLLLKSRLYLSPSKKIDISLKFLTPKFLNIWFSLRSSLLMMPWMWQPRSQQWQHTYTEMCSRMEKSHLWIQAKIGLITYLACSVLRILCFTRWCDCTLFCMLIMKEEMSVLIPPTLLVVLCQIPICALLLVWMVWRDLFMAWLIRSVPVFSNELTATGCSHIFSACFDGENNPLLKTAPCDKHLLTKKWALYLPKFIQWHVKIEQTCLDSTKFQEWFVVIFSLNLFSIFVKMSLILVSTEDNSCFRVHEMCFRWKEILLTLSLPDHICYSPIFHTILIVSVQRI